MSAKGRDSSSSNLLFSSNNKQKASMADRIIHHHHIHIHHNTLSAPFLAEDDLLADDLDDLIAEVNDSDPSLKEFSSKKYK